MNELKLREIWEKEEEAAHIHGWDFSHIHGRYDEENDLPWDYKKIIKSYLKDYFKLLDYDTGEANFYCHWDIPVIIRQLQRGINQMCRYARKDFFLWEFSLRSAVILPIFLLRIRALT